MELEKTPKTKTESITSPETGAVLSSYEVDNRKYSKLENEKNKLEKEGDDLFKKAAEFTQKEQDILKGLGVANNEIVGGSIAALEASIQKLQDKYNKAGSDKERNKILRSSMLKKHFETRSIKVTTRLRILKRKKIKFFVNGKRI